MQIMNLKNIGARKLIWGKTLPVDQPHKLNQ
jgi:hypothetical protein